MQHQLFITGFQMWTSGIRSNCSANWATTTAQTFCHTFEKRGCCCPTFYKAGTFITFRICQKIDFWNGIEQPVKQNVLKTLAKAKETKISVLGWFLAWTCYKWSVLLLLLLLSFLLQETNANVQTNDEDSSKSENWLDVKLFQWFVIKITPRSRSSVPKP